MGMKAYPVIDLIATGNNIRRLRNHPSIAVWCGNNECNEAWFGWGWNSFLLEANAGRGLKVRQWMKPMFQYVVPVAILFNYVYGMVTFQWK